MVKITWSILALLLALLFNHPVVLLGVFCLIIPVFSTAGILRNWLSFLKIFLLLAMMVIVINVLFNHNGSQIIWQFGFRLPLIGPIIITIEALLYAASMVIRLVIIMSALFLLSLTVHPDDILKTLTATRLPGKITTIIMLSSRFVPVLLEDYYRILDAQTARGVDFTRGSFSDRVKHRANLLLNLLSDCLERSVKITEAMESRGYGVNNRRTCFNQLVFSRLDVFYIISMIVAMILSACLAVMGKLDFRFYPALNGFAFDGSEWISLAIILAMIGAILPAAYSNARAKIDSV